MSYWHIAPLIGPRAEIDISKTPESRRSFAESRTQIERRPGTCLSLLAYFGHSPLTSDGLPPYYEMASPTSNLPHRDREDEAVPDSDPSDTTELLQERLQAWKHMTAYLEDYIGEVAKDEKSSAKEKEKILKTVSRPLKEGHHFDQNLGGIAGLFENLRANTQALSNMHLETSKNLTGAVLPILERLHTEIKNKTKELNSGAAKGSKAVDKARNISQKHIELLGQHTGMFDSSGGRVDAHNDPYVLQRGIRHRLNKQILEENNNRQDLLTVQDSFQQFEAHLITTVQNALNSFNQLMGGQADRQKAMYGDMVGTAQKIPLDLEWKGFINRNGDKMIDPNSPPRSMANVAFPNQGHRATKSLIEGSLERRSRAFGKLGGYSAGYYAVTPAGYLHEFKDDDDFREDPSPKVSLYLPDCTVGAVDGVKFAVKGKDVSGGKISSKLATTSEFTFKAHSPGDGVQWHNIIMQQAGRYTDSAPVSPVETRTDTAAQKPGQIDTTAGQQQGVVGGPQSAGAVPRSATSEKMTSPNAGNLDSKATGQGSHFQTQPTTNALEERKYVHQ